jgi:hypothetical protein
MDVVYLCPSLSNHLLLAQDIIILLDRIVYTDSVKTVVLSMGWLALGNPQLLKKVIIAILTQLATFNNVQMLFLKGNKENGVLHGLDNKAIRSLPFHQLTHLFIDGYGSMTFSFKSFLSLLKRNPNLQVLALSKIRGPVHLDSIAKTCPLISCLTIHLLVTDCIFDEDHLEDVAFILRARRQQPLDLELRGDLSLFHKLKSICFIEEESSKDKSRPVILRLLDSISIPHQEYISGKIIHINHSL